MNIISKTAAIMACGLAVIFSAPAAAQEYIPDAARLVTPALIGQLRDMLSTPVILMSIEAQNDRRAGLKQADIEALDAQWVKERKSDDQPLVAATLSSPASSYLMQQQAGMLGLYASIFVVDSYGLNVGQSAVTSDYWQGDEAKFQKTFPVAPDAVFVDEPEFDEAFKVWIVQVNLTLSESGKAIGAATVDLNLTELARRSSAVY